MEYNNDLIKELGTNFIEYAVACNSDRSIPDARTGLKPVARRILWGALYSGYTSNKAHVKCARLVGDVMGQWHPHGDSSIYGALVRLSQDWVMRYPLIDFHGNLGNIDGDGPAAYRYTNARLSKLAEEGLLKGIKKKCVDFIPNYDEDDEEPITLPSIFPNLLCNPNSGIGVAQACSWLPHNLNEVAQAIFDYLDGKEPIIYADFPTGGVIINKNDIPEIMKTGKGSIKVRGKYKIEDNKIIFYEIPYGIKVEDLLKNIGTACEEGKVKDVIDICNNSDSKIRIIIECNKKANIENVVKNLFLHTNLQTSLSYNQVALVGKTPTRLNLKDCIEIYVQHNLNCIKREAIFDLNKAEDRLHIVEGLLKALEDIDNIIALIKKSKDSNDAKNNLISKYNFTETQAKSILSMRLSSLAHLEKIEVMNERAELIDKITEYKKIINNRESQENILRDRLSDIVKKFGDKRRTELIQLDIAPSEKEIETVIPEDCVVIVSQSGLIKRIPKNSFKVQKRNGVGVKSKDGAILTTISTNTIDNLMIFTNKGKMYKLLVDNVPSGTNASKGTPISQLIEMENGEEVAAVTSLHRKTDAEYVVFITKNGLIKKTSLEEYTSVKRSTGIIAIKLKEGDQIANVTFLKDEDLILITKKGMAIRFKTTMIKPTGRVTMGVKGINLKDEDSVLVGIPVHKETDYLSIFTVDGHGKKMELNELTVQAKGGKGLKISKDVEVATAALISDEDNLLIIGEPNTICISAIDVPKFGRTSLGNLMIKNSKIKNIVKI